MIEQRDLFDRLMRGAMASRDPNTGQVKVFQSDVLVMLPKAMQHVPAMCQNQFWPELFAMLQGDVPIDDFMQQVAAVHKTVVTMFNSSDTFVKDPTMYVAADVGEAMCEAGWDDLDDRAKVIYMATLGYYFVAGTWASSAMRRLMGGYPGALADDIALTTAEVIRLNDQNIGRGRQVQTTLTSAVAYARMLGFSDDEIIGKVQNIVDSSDRPSTDEVLAGIDSLKKVPGGGNTADAGGR